MLERRIIVTLLLDRGQLVKTVGFKNPIYLGDPLNAVRIFNEYEVDELVFLDIGASKGTGIQYQLLKQIADQCFMPVTYGGGLATLEEMQAVFQIGFEKIAVNSEAIKNPQIVQAAARRFGRQSIVASVDYRKDWLGRRKVVGTGAAYCANPVEWCLQLERLGAGELLLNCVDRDGKWSGYDLPMLKQLSRQLKVPLVALGGASSIEDLQSAIVEGGADAAAAGSMFVFQKKGMGVLLHYPDASALSSLRQYQAGKDIRS